MPPTKDCPRYATNRQPTGKHGALKYASRQALLTPGELRFYPALRDAAEGR